MTEVREVAVHFEREDIHVSKQTRHHPTLSPAPE